jgi:HK97 family phage major capsid protein
MSCKLRSERFALIQKARQLVDKAERERRSLTGEESRSFDAMMNDADALELRYKKEEGEQRSGSYQADEPDPRFEIRSDDRRATAEYRAAFLSYLTTGSLESRALQAGNDVQGGYMAAPTQMVAEIVKFLDNTLIIRQLATKFTVASAQSLGAVSLDADPADADWTTELATGSEDSTMSFGKRELCPHPIAKRIKVSNKLLQMATGAESFVRQRLGYKFGVTEEKGFMTGDGAAKPLGIYTASSNGISAGRDVTCGTTTAITADGLQDVKYSLKQQYRNSKALRWAFHRDAVKMISKLKTGDGQYIWQPGLQAGQPDLLLETQIVESEYAPNTFTTGQYVAVLGDFSYYWIADAMKLEIQRLVELYAEANQTGFIGRLECDGMPVLEEAFARGKLA